MTVHVDDIGTVVRQRVTDLASLSGYTATLRVRRPDATTATVAGSISGVECSAIVPDGVWTIEGAYRLQFVLESGSTNFALGAVPLQVLARL